MKIKKTFPVGGGLVFEFDVVIPEWKPSGSSPSSARGSRVYIVLKTRNKHENPLVGERYERFWCGVVDRALQIAFPNQVSWVDDEIWLVSRGASGNAVKLIEGLSTFDRVFSIAVSGAFDEAQVLGDERPKLPLVQQRRFDRARAKVA